MRQSYVDHGEALSHVDYSKLNTIRNCISRGSKWQRQRDKKDMNIYVYHHHS